MSANLENSAVATGLEKVIFCSNPKEGQCQRMLNYLPSCSFHITSNVMLKILQARLQQYVNWELPDAQAGFGKDRGTRDQIANIHWILKKARAFQKNIYFLFNDYAKAFHCVNCNKVWKILKEMGISDHLTCFLRNLYVSQEATVRTRHGTMGWFKIGKGVQQGCIVSLWLFNVYAEYIMQNTGLDESQAGIKTAGRNTNNLIHADDTSVNGRQWRRTKEPLDESKRGEWKSWLKTQHSKN